MIGSPKGAHASDVLSRRSGRVPLSSTSSSSTADSHLLDGLFAMIPNLPNGDQEVVDKHKSVWLLPPVLSILSGCLYTETSRAFHGFVDVISGHSWKDFGGSDVIKEILNGPVALSVSILLGTTIQTLYDSKTITFRVRRLD